jgi:peptide/nickel transport system ATP-binding protein
MLGAYPHQLSGGQKQRVGIAAAIAAGPTLLIADEPTSALDTIVQAEIVRLIAALVRETGMSLLIVSHDIALAATIADRIVVLKDGGIVETGATEEIVFAPQADYTRSLLAACLTLDDGNSTQHGAAAR